MSENRLLVARDALGYASDKCTLHGFRSSFRDWAAEETNFPAEVAEMALAHTIKSTARHCLSPPPLRCGARSRPWPNGSVQGGPLSPKTSSTSWWEAGELAVPLPATSASTLYPLQAAALREWMLPPTAHDS